MQKVGHGFRIEPGALQHLNANTIGFLFVRLGKADHALLGAGQSAAQRRHPHGRVGHRQQDGAKGAYPGQRGVALLVFHRTRQVALSYVRDFVRQYRGELAFVVGFAEQG
ncbi:hypothetical protein D3C72_1061220 [compost metagenome]